jgi:hypothetical protein
MLTAFVSESTDVMSVIGMRSLVAMAASALAGLAAVVASLDGDGDIVPFFVGLTFLGGVVAWACHPPFSGGRRTFARVIAVVWLGAAVWVAILLIWGRAASGPTPGPEATYLGLTATIYHLVGLYGGAALIAFGAFGRGDLLGD